MPHGSFLPSGKREFALLRAVAGGLQSCFKAALAFVAAAVAPSEQDGGKMAFVATAPQARLPAHLSERAAVEDRGDGLRIARKAAEALPDGVDRENLGEHFRLPPGSRARQQLGKALQLQKRELGKLVLVPKLAVRVAKQRAK